MLSKRMILIIFLAALIVLPSAEAIKGVGIRYGIEYATVPEDSKSCISYGVYNPWDESVTVELIASGEFDALVLPTEQIELPAGTPSSEAKPIELCFDIPAVYNGDCSKDVVKYKGEVIAREVADKEAIAGTGSATTVVASAPLTLTVGCDIPPTGAVAAGSPRGATLWMVVLIIIIVAAFGFLVFMKKSGDGSKKDRFVRKYQELSRLGRELKLNPNDLYKRNRYQKLKAELEKIKRGL